MEFDLIDLIRRRAAGARTDVALGIGDDGALLVPPPGHELAVAIDTLVEGVHFPVASAPADIGWKALAVNLSDLAAMGATPAWALLSLTMPEPDADFVQAFADGFAQLASQHDVALVGGDTTGGPLSVSVCVHGFVPRGQALRRDGARVGDGVYVTGTLGDAAAALRDLDAPERASSVLRQRLDRPVPRVAVGQALRESAHACIDVSDGLLADLAHVCRASGAGADIDADRLPLSEALLAQVDVDAARRFALTGGDDYELCFTASSDAAVSRALAHAGCTATRIGEITADGPVRVLEHGHDITPERHGWEHFDA
ncbi:MAG TPA: thiamine-phosphate kinase [Oleiagrimonas sp.]|nr:thiamine-phosphate kinase [Oleiagrimonas sp.]